MAVPVRVPRAIDIPRSCRREDGTAKVVYGSRDVARRVVRDYRRSGGLHSYWCDRCQGYHIGRPSQVSRG